MAGQHTESKEALKHIAGVVFISTPHGLSDEDRLKENMSFLLNNARFGGLDKNAMSRISETFYYLIDIQKLFEETSFQFEMLSIFEKRPLDNKKATILGNKGLVVRST